MAGFLYLVAGERRVRAADLARIGLDYALGETLATVEVTGDTVARQPGSIVADPAQQTGRRVSYAPGKQTWRKMPRSDGGPELHLGYWNDAPPEPGELRRDAPLRTAPVKLDDDRFWDVPIVGHPESGRLAADLPAWMDLDDDGRRVRGAVLDQYRQLWDVVSGLADRQLAVDSGDQDASPPTDDELWDATIQLLQATYRVDICELVAMRVFTDQSPTLPWVWMVATNYQWLMKQLEDDAKKNERETPDGRSMSAGEAG